MHTWIHRRLSAGLLVVATAAALAGITPAQAVTTLTAIKSGTTTVAASPTVTTTTTRTTTFPGTLGHLPTGGFSQLTSSDCRLGGGTVVVPPDSRCGSPGAAYCRYPNTLAACLTER